MSDVARVAAGMAKAQREAMVAGHWHVASYGFHDLALVQRVGSSLMCELTQLGLQVRAHLLAAEGEGAVPC